MTKGGLKAAIPERERKLVLMVGMLALLTGIAFLGKHVAVDSIAPLLVLIGLFGLGIGTVKQKRS